MSRPRRTCSSCGGVAHWHDTAWVCSRCGDEWYGDHGVQFGDPVALADDLVVERIARKRWRCTCADDVLGYRVRGEYPGAFGGVNHTEKPARDKAHAEQMAAAMLGGVASTSGTRYERTEVVERRNRNAANRSARCSGWIERGDAYVEFLGDAAPYESGSRYCLACGYEAWGAERWARARK